MGAHPRFSGVTRCPQCDSLMPLGELRCLRCGFRRADAARRDARESPAAPVVQEQTLHAPPAQFLPPPVQTKLPLTPHQLKYAGLAIVVLSYLLPALLWSTLQAAVAEESLLGTAWLASGIGFALYAKGSGRSLLWGLLALAFPFMGTLLGLAAFAKDKRPEPATERPRQVGVAVALLYVALAIAIVHSILMPLDYAYFGLTKAAVFAIQFTSLALPLLFIFLIGRGQNWARIFALIFFLITGVPGISQFIPKLIANPVSAVLSSLAFLVILAALIFLFQKESSDWFKR